MSDDTPPKGKIMPNTFQTPNTMVDDFMRYLDGDETKCYLVVVRKTLGWLKGKDRIAKSQIRECTGLSDDRVDKCMGNLVAFGVVLRTAENDPKLNHGAEWALQMDDTKIDLPAMQAREDAKKAKDAARTQAARAKKSPAGGGDVPQPQVVAQTGGGDVPQPPQKPLSKDKDQDHVVVGAEPKINLFSEFEKRIGPITPYISEALPDLEKEHPPNWIVEAMKISEAAGKRSLGFVLGVLKRWKVDGYGTDYPINKRPVSRINRQSPQEARVEMARWLEKEGVTVNGVPR